MLNGMCKLGLISIKKMLFCGLSQIFKSHIQDKGSISPSCLRAAFMRAQIPCLLALLGSACAKAARKT